MNNNLIPQLSDKRLIPNNQSKKTQNSASNSSKTNTITGNRGGAVTGNRGGAVTGNRGGAVTGNRGGAVTGNRGSSFSADSQKLTPMEQAMIEIRKNSRAKQQKQQEEADKNKAMMQTVLAPEDPVRAQAQLTPMEQAFADIRQKERNALPELAVVGSAAGKKVAAEIDEEQRYREEYNDWYNASIATPDDMSYMNLTPEEQEAKREKEQALEEAQRLDEQYDIRDDVDLYVEFRKQHGGRRPDSIGELESFREQIGWKTNYEKAIEEYGAPDEEVTGTTAADDWTGYTPGADGTGADGTPAAGGTNVGVTDERGVEGAGTDGTGADGTDAAGATNVGGSSQRGTGGGFYETAMPIINELGYDDWGKFAIEGTQDEWREFVNNEVMQPWYTSYDIVGDDEAFEKWFLANEEVNLIDALDQGTWQDIYGSDTNLWSAFNDYLVDSGTYLPYIVDAEGNQEFSNDWFKENTTYDVSEIMDYLMLANWLDTTGTTENMTEEELNALVDGIVGDKFIYGKGDDYLYDRTADESVTNGIVISLPAMEEYGVPTTGLEDKLARAGVGYKAL